MTAERDQVAPLADHQLIPLSKITPYPENARNISDKAVEQCMASLREFGWQQPIVTDTDLVIIVGHVRHRAAARLGLDTAPVVIADKLTPARVKAYRIADNRTHDYTTWDYGLLAKELDGLDEFAEVLDLADWKGIIDAFTGGPLPNDLLDEGGGPGALGIGFPVTVVFGTQEEADLAGPALLQVPGVVNVRHPRPG